MTHFAGRPGVAVITVMDLVTRKWICEVISAEETSAHVQAAFTDALGLVGLLDRAIARTTTSPPANPPASMRR